MLTERDQEQLPPEAVLALQAGRRSDAVEIVRGQLGVSHSEALFRVQRASQHLPSQVPQSARGQEDSGTLRLVVILGVLAAIAAAFFALP